MPEQVNTNGNSTSEDKPDSPEILTARPTDVRVYRNGCVVTCVGETEVEAGQGELLVDCLVDGCDEDSIRVRVPKSVTLLSVSLAKPDRTEQRNEAILPLLSAQREHDRLKRRIETRKEQRGKWLSPSMEGASEGAFAAFSGYVGNLSGNLDALDDEILELQATASELLKKIDVLKSKSHEAVRKLSRRVVSLRIQAEHSCQIRFEVTMRSSKASWRPEYDVYVDDFESPVRIGMRAEVRQSTGFDWDDVSMTLSTSAPTASRGLPTLVPRRVSCAPDRPPVMRAKAAGSPRPQGTMARAVFTDAADDYDDALYMDAMSLAVDELRSEPVDFDLDFDLEETMSLAVSEKELANSVEYAVPGSWDLPTDESLVVDVQSTEMPAEYQWQAFPSMDDSVYIVALLGAQLDANLVGERASVHLGGEYCGSVTFPEPRQGKPPVISLGPDSRMKAFSELTKSEKVRASLLRGRNEDKSAFRLSVRSQRTEPVSLVIMGQVPVSADKDVTVSLGDLGGAKRDAETGELTWEREIAGGGEVSVEFSYAVSYPKGKELASSGRWA